MDGLLESLLAKDYDPEKKRDGSYEDIYGICKGYFAGVVLFPGTVITRNTITVAFENRQVLVSNVRQGNVVSLYLEPIKQRLTNEEKEKIKGLRDLLDKGINLPNIQPTDNPYVDGVRNNTFCLVVEDARKNNIATFEFHKHGEMLYVPKREKS
jgi:hypothetical protein